MNQADVFFRAFLAYRSETENNKKCAKLRSAITEADAEKDDISTVRSHCIIEEDWVDRIYEGLEFVEKAINEQRQHIRQQGDVVPIEKARRVSKNSVEHLARHSDMITHEPPEEEDLIPDKLYIVEKLSDFAVYENRFIYMLLCYLRDFIELRYSKIIELGHAYSASMRMNKVVKLGKRTISYSVSFSEESKDDPFGFLTEEADHLLKRIEEERHIISALLLTPLMREVSKTPKIKPPITRTNALRMDNNFKNSLALYDYIASYAGDGYRIETETGHISPFTGFVGDEISELVSLTSFLVYEHGRDLRSALRDSYQREEDRRRAEEEQRLLERINELRERAKNDPEALNEYIMRLEDRNKDLEADRRRLVEANNTIASLEESIRGHIRKQNQLKDEIDELHALCDEKDAERERLLQSFEEEKVAIRKEIEVKAEELAREAEAERNRFLEEQEQKISAIRDECDSEIDLIRRDMNEQLGLADKSVKMSAAECEELRKENERMLSEIASIKKKCELLSARLHAERVRNGSIAEEGEFSDKKRFEELEAEYFALRSLVEAEWKKAKKKIRKRILWKRPEPAEEYSEVSSENNSEEIAPAEGSVSEDSSSDASDLSEV